MVLNQRLLSITLIWMISLGVGCTPAQNKPAPEASVTVKVAGTTEIALTASEVRSALGAYFHGLQGAFVLFDMQGKRYIRYNPGLCDERFLPASTFKILNSLIGLETGVIPDENYVIRWAGRQYPNASWNQDHSLKSAFQNSVVWYYQELARRVGKEKMQHYLNAVHYGNQDLSGKLDSFWLDGGLRISPEEQVVFLKRLYADGLPFSQRSMRIVKEIMLLEKTETYRLSGKTGTTQMGDLSLGWFTGYLEERGNVYFFATFIEGADPKVDGVRAKEITRAVLKGLELLP